MQFLQLLLCILLCILGQTLLLCLLECVKNVTTGVADGDLGALANLAALLYEVATTLLGKWLNNG